MLTRLRVPLSVVTDTELNNHIEDAPRRRNRLSKPLTNRSSVSLTSPQQLSNRSSVALPSASSSDRISDHGSQSSSSEQLQFAEARETLSDTGDDLRTAVGRRSYMRSTMSLADVHAPISPNTDSDPSSPVGLFNASRLSLLSRQHSRDSRCVSSPRIDPRRVSGEEFVSPVPPVRRKSWCQPGLVTRPLREEIPETPEIAVPSTFAEQDQAIEPEQAEPDRGLGGLNISMSDQRLYPRNGTPSPMAFVGNLRLGSLQITNGCASPSPVPSERSRTRLRSLSTSSLRMSTPVQSVAQAMADIEQSAATIQPGGSGTSVNETRYRSSFRFPEWQHKDVAFIDGVHNTSHSLRVDSAHNSVISEAFLVHTTDPAEIKAAPSFLSLLDPTTRKAAVDDELFDTESVTPSITDSADHSTVDTIYSNADTPHAKSRPASRESCLTFDCDYSFELERSSRPDLTPLEQEMPLPPKPIHVEVGKSQIKRRPVPRSFPSSILKSYGETVTLPRFHNLRASQVTVVTPPTPATSPRQARRLIRRRPLPTGAPPKEIVVQGADKSLPKGIPPVPIEIAENLAIRVQQVPELTHTYEPRLFTGTSPVLSRYEAVKIKFPSPRSDREEFETVSRPRPAMLRGLFHRKAKSEKAVPSFSGRQEMSQAAAFALVQDFGVTGHSLGNPYDASRRFRSSSDSFGALPLARVSARPKPASIVDAETAAKLARLRSRDMHERKSLTMTEKRALFNDRGGKPGKSFRPNSFDQTTPPLPSLSYMKKGKYRQTWPVEQDRPEMIMLAPSPVYQDGNQIIPGITFDHERTFEEEDNNIESYGQREDLTPNRHDSYCDRRSFDDFDAYADSRHSLKQQDRHHLVPEQPSYDGRGYTPEGLGAYGHEDTRGHKGHGDPYEREDPYGREDPYEYENLYEPNSYLSQKPVYQAPDTLDCLEGVIPANMDPYPSNWENYRFSALPTPQRNSFPSDLVEIDYKASPPRPPTPPYTPEDKPLPAPPLPFEADPAAEPLPTRFYADKIIAPEHDSLRRKGRSSLPSEVRKSLDLQRRFQTRKSLDVRRSSESRRSFQTSKPIEARKSIKVWKSVEMRQSVQVRKSIETRRSAESRRSSESRYRRSEEPLAGADRPWPPRGPLTYSIKRKPLSSHPPDLGWVGTDLQDY